MPKRFNTIADVYRAATGAPPFTADYMAWCERKVHGWQAFLRSEGQQPESNFTYVRPDASRQSYLDWVIQHEGI
jgi:hypothetical protein